MGVFSSKSKSEKSRKAALPPPAPVVIAAPKPAAPVGPTAQEVEAQRLASEKAVANKAAADKATADAAAVAAKPEPKPVTPAPVAKPVAEPVKQAPAPIEIETVGPVSTQQPGAIRKRKAKTLLTSPRGLTERTKTSRKVLLGG